MNYFALEAPDERRLILMDISTRIGVLPLIVEKDFWVCWMLGRIFENPATAPHVVFKGGTSLSMVFAAIRRFSEDIDLAVSPAALGFEEADLNDAPSTSQRRKRMDALALACEQCVKERFQPALEKALASSLGSPAAGDAWLRYEIDAVAATP